jgi:outer membrane protein OmpA-like peptidoglycan-associated protein
LNAAQFVNVAAPEAGVLLYAVPDPADPRAASGSGYDALPQEPGTMVALYTVLAGLPEGVTEVDVTLGYAGIVADVPVGEGLLEPTAEGPVVPLGTGWPEVDDRFLQPVQNLVPSVRPLVTLTEQIDGASRESQTTEQVTIDISADVLFAFDSADLTPEARQRVADVAADVAGRAAPGQVSVIGHTDSTASDAYNDDLSRRRAQAVADVMAPILHPAGISLTVDGRGEREPLTDNSTEEARQLNRRVTVTFARTPREPAGARRGLGPRGAGTARRERLHRRDSGARRGGDPVERGRRIDRGQQPGRGRRAGWAGRRTGPGGAVRGDLRRRRRTTVADRDPDRGAAHRLPPRRHRPRHLRRAVVRRTSGATLVRFQMSAPETVTDMSSQALGDSTNTEFFYRTALEDPAAGQRYLPLSYRWDSFDLTEIPDQPVNACLCGYAGGLFVLSPEPMVMDVLYPPLPDAVTSVTFTAPGGLSIPDLPVADAVG